MRADILRRIMASECSQRFAHTVETFADNDESTPRLGHRPRDYVARQGAPALCPVRDSKLGSPPQQEPGDANGRL